MDPSVVHTCTLVGSCCSSPPARHGHERTQSFRPRSSSTPSVYERSWGTSYGAKESSSTSRKGTCLTNGFWENWTTSVVTLRGLIRTPPTPYCEGHVLRLSLRSFTRRLVVSTTTQSRPLPLCRWVSPVSSTLVFVPRDSGRLPCCVGLQVPLAYVGTEPLRRYGGRTVDGTVEDHSCLSVSRVCTTGPSRKGTEKNGDSRDPPRRDDTRLHLPLT